MFFFFIAGIQPKEVKPKEQPQKICPFCGINRLTLKRIDHYFTLFFIPLFRVKKGDPFFECPKCGLIDEKRGIVQSIPICPSCKREISPEYKYCPYCGKRLQEV